MIRLSNNNDYIKKVKEVRTNLVLSNLLTDFLQVTLGKNKPNVPLSHTSLIKLYTKSRS